MALASCRDEMTTFIKSERFVSTTQRPPKSGSFVVVPLGDVFVRTLFKKWLLRLFRCLALFFFFDPCETISRGPSSKNGFFPSSGSASSCALGKRFCMDPLQKMVASAPCASLTRSTLEKARDSNSLLGSEGFRIGFAKHIVGVAKFQSGSGPPHKLPKMIRFDNEFVMKML